MIKGLTDKGGSLPHIGELRKGAAKGNGNAPGKDLPHFRFTTKEKEVYEAFMQHYGSEPNDIEITFPYDKTDENFDAWQEKWVAGGLHHRCDGTTCVVLRDGKGKPVESNAPCPGGCKPVGRLHVILPRLGRLAEVTVMTTSLNDIATIHQSLIVIEMMRGSLRGIPFILRRRPRMVSVPTSGNNRARQEKWMIEIEAAPRWVVSQLIAMEQAALPPATDLEEDDPNGVDEIGVVIEGEVVEHLASAESREPILKEIEARIEVLTGLGHKNFAKGEKRAQRATEFLRQSARKANFNCVPEALERIGELKDDELAIYSGVLQSEIESLQKAKPGETAHSPTQTQSPVTKPDISHTATLTQEQFTLIGTLTDDLIKLGVFNDKGSAANYLHGAIGVRSVHGLLEYQADIAIRSMQRMKEDAEMKARAATASQDDVDF